MQVMTTIFLLALALSMDAFAASLSQGAAARPATVGVALRIGAAFGSAQAVMPLLGWGLGVTFAPLMRDVDHWIAFVLLTAIGVHMVHAGLAADADSKPSVTRLGGWALAGLAIATSIDAAAAGVTIPLLAQPVLATCAVIGIVTFFLSCAGVLLGGALGSVAGRRAEILGGLVLIGLGCKILIEHQFLHAG
jgi:putative Mn2+ efflux pump MntP